MPSGQFLKNFCRIFAIFFYKKTGLSYWRRYQIALTCSIRYRLYLEMTITFAWKRWRELLDYWLLWIVTYILSKSGQNNLLFSLIQFWVFNTSYSIGWTDWALRILFSPVIFSFNVICKNHLNSHLLYLKAYKTPALCCFQIGIVALSIANI